MDDIQPVASRRGVTLTPQMGIGLAPGTTAGEQTPVAGTLPDAATALGDVVNARSEDTTH